MVTYGYRRFNYRRSCWALHDFDDHLQRTHGGRRLIDRRSCWPWITSATTDYTQMDNAASPIGNHVNLCRALLHRPTIMLTCIPSTITDCSTILSRFTTSIRDLLYPCHFLAPTIVAITQSLSSFFPATPPLARLACYMPPFVIWYCKCRSAGS